MMNRLLHREQYLAARRTQLVARSGRERALIRSTLAGFEARLSGAEQAYRAGQWVRRNAVWLSLAGGVLMFFKRPRGLLATASRGYALWRSWRALSR